MKTFQLEKPKGKAEEQKQTKQVLILMAIFIPVVAIGFSFANQSTPPTVPAPVVVKQKATYDAVVTDYVAIDPATLRAYVSVHNSGKVTGNPRCTLSASNESAHYAGYDVFGPIGELQPGADIDFQGTITVTNEGAAYVTKAVAECYN